jgi:hypothetical protein
LGQAEKVNPNKNINMTVKSRWLWVLYVFIKNGFYNLHQRKRNGYAGKYDGNRGCKYHNVVK